MVQIQIDLDENENRIVEIFKAVNRLDDKRDAIKAMIKKFEEKYTKFLSGEELQGK